ncbi:MAG: hypothetical protein RL198_242 [Actinomycetota bacterium]
MTEYLIGRALLEELTKTLQGSRKVIVIHPKALASTAELVRQQLLDSGFTEVLQAETPDGEPAKRIEVADFCWKIMGENAFQRSDAVLAIGGGSTTDLAGFVAASWLRGIKCVYVPTTLLAMVDAAIGGKTGLNTSVGKNLVGFFKKPAAVIIDFDTLNTLPENELRSGMAEVVKYGFISDRSILEAVLADPSLSLDPQQDRLPELIRKCVAIKDKIVETDFEESGIRRVLNYGHTLGHAIEHVERYQWRHGAAISIGMIYAAELSATLGRLAGSAVELHYEVFDSLGLPVKYRPSKWKDLYGAMLRDKKGEGGILKFVLLDDIERPTVVTAPEEQLLFATYQTISE